MKCTGIVRRMDDLGRVVIPKEVRRTMKITEGDALEIFVDHGAILLKKYTQDIAEQWHTACAEYVAKISQRPSLMDVRYIHANYVTTCIGYRYNSAGKYAKHVGIARLNVAEDKYDPIIGQAIAYCRAVNGQDCDYIRIIGLEG